MKNDKPYVLTPQGKQNLVRELEQLRTDRPAALVDLQRARAMGDLRENSAYQAARERLTNLDRRIVRLELTIRNSIVVDNKHGDVVDIGSTVEVESRGIKTVYIIVGDMEMDIKAKKISLKSPLGAALSGHKKGDMVKLTTPGGEAQYHIVSVS